MTSNVLRWRWWWLRPQFRDEPQNLLEHLPWDGDLGHLEDNIAAVAHYLRADLDQLVLQTRQRPVLDRLRRRQRAQEIAEIVGERMKLEPHRVGGKRSARQPRPLDRPFALFDPLLARPALVVEGNDALGRAGHVGDDEPDARIEFARMPFDLGDHSARLRPASGLVGEIGEEPPVDGPQQPLPTERSSAGSKRGWNGVRGRLETARSFVTHAALILKALLNAKIKRRGAFVRFVLLYSRRPWRSGREQR